MTLLTGVVIGAALTITMTTGLAQTTRLPGDNYMNHIAIAVENFDAALAFYTQKMGFGEAFVIRNDKGEPTLAYVQVSRNTFVELQTVNATRRPGLNHFGLHVADLNAVVARLKERGVTVEDVRVRPDDSSVANVTDPSGLRIELFQFGPGSAQGKAIASWK
jgi:catechol 2,3-dioxygenase-like lactoylglutathione lyase family enzyme